jgi:large subunit ribosomal protein L21
MSFAVIETGGKQYRVSPGNVLTIEKLEAEEGATVSFGNVLMYQDSQDPVVGTPYVDGVSVTAEVLGQAKGPKIRVFTYKPKKRQRRTVGHRQQVTQVRIVAIATAEEKKVAKPAAKATARAKKEEENA